MNTLSKRILLVDDDENILFLFGLVLEDNGFEVETATCGYDALALCTKNRFDLAILDYKLADMTGDQVAAKISLMNENTRILMVTGYRTVADRINRIPDSVIDKVLLKPLSEDDLISETNQLL